MTDKLNCLKPEHGKPFVIDIKDKSQDERMSKLVALLNSISLYIMVTSLRRGNMPCIQCFKDVALECRDAGSLIEEIIQHAETSPKSQG